MAKEIKRRRRKVEKDEGVKVTKSFEIGTARRLPTMSVPCVYVEKGVTKNMDNFNSARVSIGMLLPIDYTDVDLAKAKEAIEVIDEIIVNRLADEIDELLED